MANGSRQAAWEFFGTELKRRREDAGITQVELGARVFVSGGYIGQFEQAIRKPQLDVAQRIDEALQTDGIFERLCRKLIDDPRYADYFAGVVELERLATKICEFAPTVVPGLLQTADYARAVTIAANPFKPDSYVDEIAQLEHVARLMRERAALVTVLSFGAGAHAAMGGMLKLMSFGDAPPVAYTETEYAGTLIDAPAVVAHAQRTYDLLRVAALSPEASLALIDSAAEDFRRCASTT
ncbi:helix-turn-helix domain-containing protein [Streptomyces tendae]|uniref:helix-turn-helix domain-containing protein n=1 Tax=Streptomyces tendae TaxID=1932 RepID=UPI00384D903F